MDATAFTRFSSTPTATICLARSQDWKFLDHLQRKHHDAVGFLPRVALERAIERGQVMLALDNGEPAGYVYGQSPYQRREHVAIIYQAAICFDARRRLLGTALVEAFLARFPPTVTQACLWCASDLDSGLFWSALGFAAVARRDGARSAGRTHLFWCRHLNREAEGGFWVPESTHGGVIREGRKVARLNEGEDCFRKCDLSLN